MLMKLIFLMQPVILELISILYDYRIAMALYAYLGFICLNVFFNNIHLTLNQ